MVAHSLSDCTVHATDYFENMFITCVEMFQPKGNYRDNPYS